MKTLTSYCAEISVNTLFIVCNDCFQLKDIINNPRFVVATAFANQASSKNGFDENWLKYHLETDKIEQVVVAGHCNCNVIPFLIEDGFSNSHWIEAKKSLLQIEEKLGSYSKMNSDQKKNFIACHIALQMNRIIDLLRKTNSSEKIVVKGILIDENEQNSIREIDELLSLKPESLN